MAPKKGSTPAHLAKYQFGKKSAGKSVKTPAKKVARKGAKRGA
jgi:hypothetical protein